MIDSFLIDFYFMEMFGQHILQHFTVQSNSTEESHTGLRVVERTYLCSHDAWRPGPLLYHDSCSQLRALIRLNSLKLDSSPRLDFTSKYL